MPTEPQKQMTLIRTFDVPREQVWDAWTDPEHFSYWFGGKDMSVPLDQISLDVRPGGAWKATMIDQAGKVMAFAGRYVEVHKPEKLVMTFASPDNLDDPNAEVLTVTFKDLDGKTEVMLHQAGYLPDEQYPKLVEGYGIFMDAMEELLTELQ